MAARSSKGKKNTQRKLTAILCADVVGYSRLMGDDEEATIETLTAYRKIFTSKIKKHRGHVVDAKGDAILAEFASVVDAVNGAVEIQKQLVGKNAELPDDRRMDFRIGINLGDVVVKDDVIYGDGVNVAARLEALAEPGGICISRPVHDQVESKLNLDYVYLGEQEVKNIAKPVRAYCVLIKPEDAETPALETIGTPDSAAATTNSLWQQSQPSVAVLPFVNMSGDPEQDYFSDGITEDLITYLSKISRLSVTARNTVFTYKGKAVNVQQVGRELDVDYVLEGSVRKAGSRVRITAQLIDVSTGNHVWAERYDRELHDIFEVQDEITEEIVAALDIKLVEGEQARLWRKSTGNMQAYDLHLRGLHHWRATPDPQGAKLASRLYEQAIALDPEFSRAYVALAWIRFNVGIRGWSQTPEESFRQGIELATKAIALDESLADAYTIRGVIYSSLRQHAEALIEAERGFELNPSGTEVIAGLARCHLYSGNYEKALETAELGIRMAPVEFAWLPSLKGRAYFHLENFAKSIHFLKKSLQLGSDNALTNHVYLVADYTALEQHRQQEAQADAHKLLQIAPRFSLQDWAARQPYKNPAVTKRMMELLRKAGLPE